MNFKSVRRRVFDIRQLFKLQGRDVGDTSELQRDLGNLMSGFLRVAEIWQTAEMPALRLDPIR